MSYTPNKASTSKVGIFKINNSDFDFSNNQIIIKSGVTRGAFRCVASQAITANTAFVEFNLTYGYSSYYIYMQDVLATATVELRGVWKTNNSASYVTSNYYYKEQSGSTLTTAQSYFYAADLTTNYPSAGIFRFFNTNNTTYYKTLQVDSARRATSLNCSYKVVANYNDTAAVNAIKLYPSSGSISRGFFALYGLKESA